MTINQMIETLTKLKDKVGGNEEFPIVLDYGENEYLIPDYVVIRDLKDQNGNKFKCAFVAEKCGSELGPVGEAFYEWRPRYDKMED